jgi:hypothetical protein
VSIEAVITRMEPLLDRLTAADDARRYFHAIYLRTTRAVAHELETGSFLDRAWVEDWDVAFADLYLDALETGLDGGTPPKPWQVAFRAAVEQPELPPLRHVLFAMNGHVNYDLPLALLAVIPPADFDDAAVMARRESDHQRIDDVLASRVGSEDAELAVLGGRTLTDRLLAPLNRRGTKRFLVEARTKVWRNAKILDTARRESAPAYDARVAELETLAGARVADLVAPGLVILRLARKGFGVSLP